MIGAVNCHCADCLVLTQDDRTILRAHISALPIQRRGVMGLPENVEELLVGNLLRVELDLDHLRVTSMAAADFFVGWILLLAASVAAGHRLHAIEFLEDRFHAPEA